MAFSSSQATIVLARNRVGQMEINPPQEAVLAFQKKFQQ